MKVLKNNYQANTEEDIKKFNLYPRKMICEKCRSELEYEKSDLRMGEYGAMFLDCPCCGYNNMLEENENSIILSKDNVEFPIHFHHTSKETGAIDVCNNTEIKERIRKAIDYFRKNKDTYFWQSECGNLYLIVIRYEGDENYEVKVTNNYYSTYIPFESEDYKKVG